MAAHRPSWFILAPVSKNNVNASKWGCMWVGGGNRSSAWFKSVTLNVKTSGLRQRFFVVVDLIVVNLP